MPECSICKCDMDVDPFDAAASEGLCGTDCFRLKCKHAFHATCVIQSLRAAGAGCPVCRDGGENARGGATRIIFEMQLDDDEEDQAAEDAERNFLDQVVHSLNTTSQAVMAAKRNLNQSVKAYNIFRDKLRKERKQVLQTAMREFRARRYQEFRKVRDNTSQALSSYHQELRRHLGNLSEEDLEFSTPEEFLRQPVHMGSSVRHQDPMRLSFWHHG
jgi:hypothetical protein